jgi:hypothetical protein
MGYQTLFHGMLEFNRPMNAAELGWIEEISEAGHNWPDDVSDAVWNRAKTEQAARGRGPTMIHGPSGAELSAQMQGYIVGDGLSADDAGALRISDDRRGLVYAAEKTYDMIGGINFIIVNARTRIPDFGLNGVLAADTEFEPHLWFVKISPDGMAYSENTTRDEFLSFRRKLYPDGYHGYGLIDPAEQEAPPPRGTASVGVGLYEGKATILLHVADGDADAYSWLSPREAWKLAADLARAALRLQEPGWLRRARHLARPRP